eukprot:6179145-Lingulodinium_polyedra.AAC.1
MALLRKATRLTPDPQVSVCTLEAIIQRWCVLKDSFDLATTLGALDGPSLWKAAPKPSQIYMYKSLLHDLLSCCPSGCLSHKKLTAAPLGLHQQKTALISKLPPELLAAKLSGMIRALLAKMRLLKDNEKQRSITLGKAFW